MEPVNITVQVPPDQYRALLSIASRRNTQAHRLIEDLITRALNGPPAAQQPQQRTRNNAPIDGVEFRRLYDQHLSDKLIATRLGISTTRAHAYRTNTLGLPPIYGPGMRTDVDLNALRALHGQGLNDAQISQRLSISHSLAHARRVELGLPKNTKTGRKPNEKRK